MSRPPDPSDLASRGVSIVLVSYDRPDDLLRSIATVFGQSCRPLELIVVDNLGPTSDRIRRSVRALQSPDGVEVRLIALMENLGFAGSVNKGLEAARGRYVYITLDDLLLESPLVATLVEYIDRHPQCALA